MSEQLEVTKMVTRWIVLDKQTDMDAAYLRNYELLSEFEQEYADAYSECLQNGCSEKLADMLASQAPPMSNTDREFLEGQHRQFEKQPKLGDHLKSVAESHGQSVTGKIYIGQLARFPGDPQAWVDGRGDVKRVCEERGWGCEGSLNMKPREAPIKRARSATAGSLAARLHAAGLPLAS